MLSPSFLVNNCQLIMSSMSALKTRRKLIDAMMTALLLYEYCLTLGDEVNFIWGRKLHKALVFCLNRATMVGLAVTGLLAIFPWDSAKVSVSALHWHKQHPQLLLFWRVLYVVTVVGHLLLE